MSAAKLFYFIGFVWFM